MRQIAFFPIDCRTALGVQFLAAAFCLSSVAGAQLEPVFDGAQVQLGGAVYGLIAEDFSGDGVPDLFCSHPLQDRVSISLGVGDGSFENAMFMTVNGCEVIAAGDVNGDGFLDGVGVEFDPGVRRVHSFLSDGLGGFSEVISNWPSATDQVPTSIDLGDVNGDGALDLVACLFHGQSEPEFPGGFMATLLGDGAGGFFSNGLAMDVGSLPREVLLADFDENGTLDVAVGNAGSDDVTLLFGDGFGGFPAVSTLPGVSQIVDLSVADFDHDTHLDLLLGGAFSVSVGILSGDGAGGFALSTVALGQAARTVLAVDANGDGWADIVSGEGRATLLLNDQAGGFVPGAALYPPNTSSLAAADLDGDGRVELIVGHTSEGVSIHFTEPSGQFTTVLSFDESVDWIEAHDFNHDSQEDLLYQRSDLGGIDGISVRLGVGDGTYGPEAILLTDNQSSLVAIADWNGDGVDDVLSVNSYDSGIFPSEQSLSIHLGDGFGGFALLGAELQLASLPVSFDAADLNGNGSAEFLILDAGGALTKYARLGNGSVDAGTPLGFAPGTRFILADLTRDGAPDYVTIQGNTISLRANNGMGDFGTASMFTTGLQATAGAADAYELKTADLNGDGWVDIVAGRHKLIGGVTYQLSGLLSTPTGLGAPKLSQGWQIDLSPTSTVQLTLGDVDGDGLIDAVVNGRSTRLVRGRGALGWRAPESFSGYSGGVAITDSNSDGYPDLVLSMYDLVVLPNRALAPEGVTAFGMGTPGCDGVQLALTNRTPQLGSTDFVFSCNNAPAHSIGLLAGSQGALEPGVLAAGVLVHLNPAGPLFRLDFVQSDANGLARFAENLPTNPSLAGLSYTRQFVWAWPTADCSPSALGWSTSRAVTVTLF